MVVAFASGQIPADIHPAIMVPLIYSTLMVGYPVIVAGLLLEMRRPTLDLTPEYNELERLLGVGRILGAGAKSSFGCGFFDLVWPAERLSGTEKEEV